jgi:hypothetical protein
MKGELPEEVLEFFRQHGRKGGKLSGKARLSKMTAEQRKAVAKRAAAASAKVRSEKAARKKAVKKRRS